MQFNRSTSEGRRGDRFHQGGVPGSIEVSGTSFPGLSGADAGVLMEGAPHRVHGVAHIAPIREILQ